MDAEEIQAQLERCRRLAREIGDAQTRTILKAWAVELEQQLLGLADPLDGAASLPAPA